MTIKNHLSLGQMKYLYRCRGLRRKIHWSFFVWAFGWGGSSFLLLIRRRPECMLILWRGGCFEFFFVILVSIWKVLWTLNCCICIGFTIKLIESFIEYSWPVLLSQCNKSISSVFIYCPRLTFLQYLSIYNSA